MEGASVSGMPNELAVVSRDIPKAGTKLSFPGVDRSILGGEPGAEAAAPERGISDGISDADED